MRGEGREAVLYMDLGCPRCAVIWPAVSALPLSIAFRHFPVKSKHPRAPALHAAAEAAGRQGRFFEMVDSLFADRGRVDDPHLWRRARELALDLDCFEADRRSSAVELRVRSDFEGAIRAGVMAAPTAFLEGRMLVAELERELAAGADL